MTGTLVREKNPFDFRTQPKELARTVENLINYKPEERALNQVSALVQIIKKMQFFLGPDNNSKKEFSDEEALMIAKRLKYRYVPKGENVRRALEKNTRLYYIMAGKVVCSFPSETLINKWKAEKKIKFKVKSFIAKDDVIEAATKTLMNFKASDLFSVGQL